MGVTLNLLLTICEVAASLSGEGIAIAIGTGLAIACIGFMLKLKRNGASSAAAAPSRSHRRVMADVCVRKERRVPAAREEECNDNTEGGSCPICVGGFRGVAIRQYPCCLNKVCAPCYKRIRIERDTCPFCNVNLDFLDRKARLFVDLTRPLPGA
ncbi:unnamed protein product [Vitrella brassicaformis CCMP3155]|uniref:RING-type domain-containing protein n=1 Tax=Vitrella brassicaformis (strain CCMP3155) TaxID=1169540 RepID=A0A0G4EB68_VITBC|nr:unnamed protein product [Vitrella brassicaformis CCMP3155]|eukprot:CEL92744.1 unnamed protein product [Vitrella brassicaformis CCMP3155]